MNRQEFEHVLRAAADVVRDELVVVGSQSILAGFPDAPPSLLRSQEVDVYPRSDPERAQEIDGAIGDGSMFHATYGYYAHGVGPETIQAPPGWEERLERLDLPAIQARDLSRRRSDSLAPRETILAACSMRLVHVLARFRSRSPLSDRPRYFDRAPAPRSERPGVLDQPSMSANACGVRIKATEDTASRR